MLEFTQNIAITVISVNAKLTGSTLIFAATVRERTKMETLNVYVMDWRVRNNYGQFRKNYGTF